MKVFVDFTGWIHFESSKAILLRPEDGDYEDGIWLPKSLVGLITYEGRGDSYSVEIEEPIEAIEIEEWKAVQEGLL